MTVTRPLSAAELLDLADELAGRGTAGQPTPIRLRRSISSAYYAIFHELSFRATQRLLGSADWGAAEAAVVRWVTHTDLASLAVAATGGGNQALRVALGSLDERVVRIARAFLDVQVARERADYDDTFDVSTAVALSIADLARDTVNRSVELSDAGDPTYGRFLALAMGGVKVAKNR
ncbi:hypothetical protein E9529_14720 [Blastococcus sp. KM273128]|uniref:hypothetical protein n=1 Tax=Blastococcus sp. KM273128 TaxID=2570314 RepID=UPI001F29A989|nr:hypothetical protein [Blastococcus sp. KM273128]MCF6745501.1 hypothetical protein [Blastococcus sp. KM273128]